MASRNQAEWSEYFSQQLLRNPSKETADEIIGTLNSLQYSSGEQEGMSVDIEYKIRIIEPLKLQFKTLNNQSHLSLVSYILAQVQKGGK